MRNGRRFYFYPGPYGFGLKVATVGRVAMIDPQAVEDVLNSCTSPVTRQVYTYCIKQFQRWYNLTERKELNASTLVAYRAKLTKSELSSSTINVSLSAVKRLAYHQNQDDAMAVWKIERQVKLVRANTVKRKKSLKWFMT